MPIKHAAAKALRKTKKATARNRRVKESLKKLIKDGERAIAARELEKARNFISALAQAVDKAAKRNIIKKNRANRIKSRFAKQVVALR